METSIEAVEVETSAEEPVEVADAASTEDEVPDSTDEVAVVVAASVDS